jgi:hypothetical protein
VAGIGLILQGIAPMNTFRALFAAVLAAAIMASFVPARAETRTAAVASVQVALNPQPLPPFVDPDHYDAFDFG